MTDEHSKRHEPCGNCGDPTYVCPGHIRIHIRCCHQCTHRFPRDDEHAELLDWQTAYRAANP